MNTNPLLSVVVPVYNVETWLDDCLNSILAQTISLEVLVISDASPDRSIGIAREFALRDSRVKVHENPINIGLGATRNVGLRLARGKYITFPDSDDIVSRGAYDRMVASLEETGSDFATSRADEFGRTKSRKRYWTTRGNVFLTGAERTCLDADPELIYDHTAWTKVFRTSFMVQNEILWAEGVKCEDVVPSTRAYLAAGSIDVVPVTSYLYRRRGGSITSGLDSEQPLIDWAGQTAEALSLLESSHTAALHEYVTKVLSVEAWSRVKAMQRTTGTEGAMALTKVLVPLVRIAGEHGLFPRLPGHVLGGVQTFLQAMVPSVEDSATERALARSIGLLTSYLRPREILPSDGAGTPKLSIVMPTHDVREWIDESIKSIVEQDYRNLELIIVDDGSTDGTWEILKEWAASDRRISLHHNPGSGGAQARNFGVSKVSGEYLTFCDGDDIVPAGAYTKMMNASLANDAEMVVGDFQKFWPSSVWRNSAEFGLDKTLPLTNAWITPRLIRNRTCWNRLFKTDFFRSRQFFFPSTPRANDIVPMTSALLAANRVSVVSSTVYHYRARPGGSSMTAGLGTARSTIGYFDQERVCAALVLDSTETPLTQQYWIAALGVDGWGNLRKLLSGDFVSLGDAGGELAYAVASLLELAPASALEAIGPRQTLAYALTAGGRFDMAAQLIRLEHDAKSLSLGERVESALACLLAAEELGADRDALLKVYWADVLRPAIDQHGEWDWVLAERCVQATRALDERVELADAATPGTREPRVLNSILRGGVEDLWQELHPAADRPEMIAVVEKHSSTTLHLRISGWNAGACPLRLEAVDRRMKNAAAPSRLIGRELATTGSFWRAVVDLSHLEPHGLWELRLVLQDEFGEIDQPLAIQWNAEPRRFDSIAAVPGEADRIRVLRTGTKRLEHAVRWRLTKLARARRRNKPVGSRVTDAPLGFGRKASS